MSKKHFIAMADEADDFTLTHKPIEDTIKITETADGFKVSYLVEDHDPINPFENEEGNGRFIHWKDHGKEQYKEYCQLRGMDEDSRDSVGPEHVDSVLIDKYEHSGIAYSVKGEGMNCRWDTSSTWAVWMPDDVLIEEAKALTGDARYSAMVKWARQACELFNQWANGDVYGVVHETFDKQKNQLTEDACWGYYGREHAEEEL